MKIIINPKGDNMTSIANLAQTLSIDDLLNASPIATQPATYVIYKPAVIETPNLAQTKLEKAWFKEGEKMSTAKYWKQLLKRDPNRYQNLIYDMD